MGLLMSEADLPDDDTGVKKSFWDHLRDLRTALLRSVVAIGVGLIVCLLGAKYLIVALEYPLKHINVFAAAKPSVAFRIGNTELGPYEVAPEQFTGLPTTGAPQVIYQIGVAEIGGQKVATLTPVPPKPGEENLGSLRVRLMNLSPAEAFFVAFRVALYGSLVLTAPFWLFFMGQFFLPALNVRERRVLYQWFGWGVLLFFTGVLLTHFLLLPIALRASVEYSQAMGFEAYDWRAESYIGFVTKFLLGMGLGFQCPVVVLLLVKLGLMTADQLAHYRRHVIVLSLILGALLTTPEVITQISMAVPMYLLYELSILIARYWDWKRRRAEAAAT